MTQKRQCHACESRFPGNDSDEIIRAVERKSISRQFPDVADLIPCWREFDPCCGRIDSLFRRTGNSWSGASQTAEFVYVFGTSFSPGAAKMEQIARSFPVWRTIALSTTSRLVVSQ